MMKDIILNYIKKSKNKYITYILKDISLLNIINQKISDNISLKEKCFLLLHDLSKPPKCSCGNPVKFISIQEGYRKYCSSTCKIKTQDRILSASKAYQKQEVKDKAKAKLKKTMLLKYGVEHNSKLEKVKKKRKETFIAKYGVDNPGKSPIIKDKIIETNLKKYGVTSVLNNLEIREKIKNTNLKKYGVDNPLKSKEILNKIKDTNLKKYNSEHSTQKHYTIDQLNILNNPDLFLEFCKKYQNTTELILFLEFCKKYQNTTELIADLKIDRTTFFRYVNLYNIKDELNYNLYSWPELILKNFINSLEIKAIFNTRKVIDNYELDCYLPDYKLAIEINGLYFHSELSGKKSPQYHFLKTKACKNLNIKLLHIWDIEVLDDTKFSIWKRKILNLLGMGDKGPGGREYEIKEIGHEYSKFLTENHIQGTCPAKFKFGGFINDELNAVMAFNKNKQGWELVRWCINKSSPGLFTKMLKFSVNKLSIDYVYTYADMRYSYGDVYIKNDFVLEKYIQPTYYYTDYKKLWHRSNFMKNKIKEKFNIDINNKTEKEIMFDLGYDRIWDAGKIRFGKYFI